MKSFSIDPVRHGAQCVRRCLGLVVTLISAAACAPSPEPAPTVEYYRAHREERLARLAECANDPSRLARTAACENAKAAAKLEDVGSLRDLPAMGLPGADKQGSAHPDRPGA